MKRRVLSMVIVLALCFTLLPATALALDSSDYGLWVGGVAVNISNKGNITGDDITGTVSYDPDRETLTLNNATVRGDSGDTVNGRYDDSIAVYANHHLTRRKLY